VATEPRSSNGAVLEGGARQLVRAALSALQVVGHAIARLDHVTRGLATRGVLVVLLLCLAFYTGLNLVGLASTTRLPSWARVFPHPPAPPQEAPAEVVPEPPAAVEGAGQEAPAAVPPRAGPTAVEALGAAAPLLLSLFWLTCAYLFDNEARRLFVARDEWGERRSGAYTAVALGCVTPLLFLGLLVGAWGIVRLAVWTVRMQAWVATGRVLAAVALFYLALLTIRWLLRPRPAPR
jgi:hypothetical protein